MIKKLLFTSALTIATSFAFSQVLYDDFETDATINYKYVEGTLDQGFANPSTGGINASATCGQYARIPEQVQGVVMGPFEGRFDNIADYVSGTKKISMDVYMDGSVGAYDYVLRITLQNGAEVFTASATDKQTGRHSMYKGTYLAASIGSWQTVEFAFYDPSTETTNPVTLPASGISDTNVDEMIIEFDYQYTNDANGVGLVGAGYAETFYIDNINGPSAFDPCAGTTPETTILDNFECQRNFLYEYNNGGFGSVDNPLNAGLNTSDKVGKFVKDLIIDDGAFGGSLPADIENFTTATYNTLSFKLYNPSGTANQDTLKVGLQDANSSSNQEALVFYLASPDNTSSWINYEVDLASSLSPSAEITDLVFLWNPHTSTADEIYIDSIALSFVETPVDPVSVEEKFVSEITMYPNPANDWITFISPEKIEEIRIIDISGKLVIQTTVNSNEYKLNISSIAKGNYNAIITFNDDSKVVRKIIK